MKNIKDFINESSHYIQRKFMKGGKEFLDAMTYNDKDPKRFCKDMVEARPYDAYSTTYKDPNELYKDAMDSTKQWEIVFDEHDETLTFKCGKNKVEFKDISDVEDIFGLEN